MYSGLADWYINGREFIKDSASVNAVINSSSLTFALPGMAKIAGFAAFITTSYTPQSMELRVD